ncbi:hypothetical protein A8B79_14010 [Balneola sp. EhC07]|uniref:GLUG motif-containing protein n=2 Tax=Pseudomonadati TaxID=3379134 RepID=UPI0007F3DEA1|nr:GLUG motif-containing protein [Balneola sp. EhC07]OAN64105.1 hypothetical protein A8B79_14010 [Balneola sp. EhC07]
MKNNSRITRHTKLLLTFLLTFLVSNYGYSQTAIAPSGSGTSGSPYQISSLENLYWISQNTSSWNSYFEQTADIDASSTANWDDGNGGDAEGFSPIGISFSDDFGGTYDGAGYTISGLTINRTVGDAIGLFGIAYRANVSNLTLQNVDISCTASTYCGALVGLTGSSSEYSNISVSGSVTGNSNLGGIIGWISQSQISHSHFNGSVTGVRTLGGLVGNVSSSTVTNSSALGSVTGNTTGSSSSIGGLVGMNDQSGVINLSFADVDIPVAYSSVGGLVGTNNQSSSISNSYALGTVNGTVNIGGLVGTNNSSSSITDSYSTGAASGSFNFAGLLGSNSGGTITGSFWNTETSGLSTGIASDNNSQSATGLTSDEMLDESSFTGLDFSSTWNIYEELSYPFIQSNVPDTLPGGAVRPLGSGTEAEPFQISNLSQLRLVSADTSYWNEHLIQTADIDASETLNWNSGSGFSPIGSSSHPFTGSYNGQEHSISNLYIIAPRSGRGFIGHADGALVKNISLSNVNITSSFWSGGLIAFGNNISVDNVFVSGQLTGKSYAGGLVGWIQGLVHISNSSTNVSVSSSSSNVGGLIGQSGSISEGSYISNSYASGNVTGIDYVGGLIGSSRIEITKSYATGDVSGTNYIGGLAGFSRALASENYALGNVSGTEYVGGLIGHADTSPINNNYAAGEVSGITKVGGLIGRVWVGASGNYSTGLVTGTNEVGGLFGYTTRATQDNFWDVENSGQTDAVGAVNGNVHVATGLTTSQMYQKSSFSGFDFDSTWAAHSNFTKPYLQSNHKDTVDGYFVDDLKMDGNGTEADPFQIKNLIQLRLISADTSFWNEHLIQTANINASETSSWNSGSGFVPLGTAFNEFTGAYNGQNYTITGLYISRGSGTGFFGRTNGANISNVILDQVDITGSSQVGGLIGQGKKTVISNAHVSGSITGTILIGGLVGDLVTEVSVSNSSSSATVTSTSLSNQSSLAGGLIGRASDLSDSTLYFISTSHATGNVTGENFVGGLVGELELPVKNSYATGNVSGGDWTGGLAGRSSQDSILISYATGDVSGNNYVGGLIGHANSTVFDAYATGNVDGNEYVGGLIGRNGLGFIINTYSGGAVTGNLNVGGIAGYSTRPITSAYWDIENSGQTVGVDNSGSSNVIGLTSSSMKQKNNFSSFDFDSTWAIHNNFTKPYLQSNHTDSVDGYDLDFFTLNGAGTEADPYQIATLPNLSWLSETDSVWDKYFVQTANIDASPTITWDDSAGFSPIGSWPHFRGSYDGDNHTISGLYINRPSNEVGLFVNAGTGSIIQNLGVTDIDFTGEHVAGMARNNRGTISNSYSTGSITASSTAGGFVGQNIVEITNSYSTVTVNSSGSAGGFVRYNFPSGSISGSHYSGEVTGATYAGGFAAENAGTITTSYAMGTVQAGTYGGGFVGYSSGSIDDSYSTADISGTERVGGFIGRNHDGTISRGYATGVVFGTTTVGGLIGLNEGGTVAEAYWDSTASGQLLAFGSDDNSQMATGLSTSQSKTKVNYSGFDFSSVWTIHSNFTRPYLQSNHKDSVDGFDLDFFTVNGIGTEADPYQIANLANLSWISDNETEWSKHFQLTDNIDASPSQTWNDSLGFSPIGNSSTKFTGSLDGQNHYINGLTINQPSSNFLGLFGYFSDATIANLHLEDIDYKASSYVGGLVGFNAGSTITNTTISGSLVAKDRVGGLIGWTQTAHSGPELSVVNSSSSVDVTGALYTGGLIGYNGGPATISNAYATGTIVGTRNVGGLIGYNSEATISGSYSTGDITADGQVGGLVSFNRSNSTIINSFSTSDITAGYIVGGLVAYNVLSSTIENSYASGAINATSTVGGLVASLESNASIINSYWNTETTNRANATGNSFSPGVVSVKGFSTEELKNDSSYTNWDFADTWVRPNGSVLPTLQWSDYRLGGPEIKGSQGWRMFGAPFANSTFATITDSLWTQGIEGASTSKGRSNIYTWNESSQSWGIPDSINASASSGKGFMMYVFEDDSYGTPGTQGGFPKSIISEGNGVTLPQTIPLSYTEGAISNLNGINLISNPSFSTLNWEEITKTNTTGIYYVWDGANGHYDAYQTGVGGTNSATKYIAPFQGFYVKATAVSAELNIDSTAIASTDTVAYKVNAKNEIFSLLLHLENKNGLSDELRLVVREEAHIEYDEFDAPEFGSFAESFLNISSQLDSINLVIDSRPYAEILSFDLALEAQNTSGQTSLSIAENKLPENWTIELVNTVTEERFDLTQEEVSLSISETNAKPSSEPKKLRTKSSTVKPIWKVVINTTGIATNTEDEVGLPDKFSLSQNYPNPFNPSTTINYDLPKASVVKLTVFDILGRKVATLANERKEAGYHQVVFDARALASGVYLYRLEAGNNIFIKKLTLIK